MSIVITNIKRLIKIKKSCISDIQHLAWQKYLVTFLTTFKVKRIEPY